MSLSDERFHANLLSPRFSPVNFLLCLPLHITSIFTLASGTDTDPRLPHLRGEDRNQQTCAVCEEDIMCKQEAFQCNDLIQIDNKTSGPRLEG